MSGGDARPLAALGATAFVACVNALKHSQPQEGDAEQAPIDAAYSKITGAYRVGSMKLQNDEMRTLRGKGYAKHDLAPAAFSSNPGIVADAGEDIGVPGLVIPVDADFQNVSFWGSKADQRAAGRPGVICLGLVEAAPRGDLTP